MMTEEESLFVRIKFIVDMYSSGVISSGCTLEQIVDLIDKHDWEEQE